MAYIVYALGDVFIIYLNLCVCRVGFSLATLVVGIFTVC